MLDTILPFATQETAGPVHNELWRDLVPLLAGRARVRVSRDNGRNYRQRDERILDATLPSRPAAVMLHDATTGLAKILAIDFDSGTRGVDQVEIDVRRTQAMLSEHGIRWIHDRSPSAGEHLYVPISGGITTGDAVDFLRLLAFRCPTVDPMPHMTVQHGCIRMPGSPHKLGGRQELLMSPKMALTVANSPAPRPLFDALHRSLEHLRPATPEPEPVGSVNDRDGQSEMNAGILTVARNGFQPGGKYDSPSEARFAVLRAATNAGFDTPAIYQRMNDGRWPGLNTLFSRYRSPLKELQADLNRLQSKGHRGGHNTVVKNNTSQPKAQGGTRSVRSVGFYEWLKIWRNASHARELTYGPSRVGLQLRLVLRALGEAASKSQSSFIEFGCRALAIATGLDHSTVSRHLRRLRAEAEPLVRLSSPAHGKYADTYELVVPEGLVNGSLAISYRVGKLHALRPVFRALGVVAAFVYEALEQGMKTAPEIMRSTGLSRSATQDALAVLEGHHLAVKAREGWIETGANLRFLADLLGATDDVEQQRNIYAQQRFLWVSWLNTRLVTHSGFAYPDQDYPFDEFEPSEDTYPPPG
ncbi:MarR family transcriptional regulator [Paeniglutamicibacter cryotolerans]|uniref:DNA-binding transcriptional ArsR family regulator n=1 Tax=Paeniglutamicibacter cryotolerans TaxID=670079 RepID=A0A839QU94_9MICC|nr:MarR family transcriptional regulator [Paeniglutamicibacter cryotolerans]MBB2997536.1 DNA-binding transcriptional ArsR family regulator [Paeniglutamicibacter cryotolerans]